MNPSTILLYLLRAMIFVASIGPAHAIGQEQGTVAYADSVQTQQTANAAPVVREAAPQRAITRIALTAIDMPAATKQRDLPTYQTPHAVAHQLARDVSTLKAARAALQLQDASHSQRLASLR
jgi:hypothetical protein